MYNLNREIILNTNVEKAWDFIKDPRNLDRITPNNLQFQIVSSVPEEMFNGLLIEYLVKIPIIGNQSWLTEIKHIREKHSFVDEQRVGPYTLWYHYHEIQPVEGGVKVIDRVTYKVPFGILGKIVHVVFIKKMLEEIFDYREKNLSTLLSK